MRETRYGDSVSGTIAVGLVFVLLLGEIDLSVGSVAAASAEVLRVLVVDQDWPWWAAVIAMLGFGTLIGVLQGAWFALFRVPSFVVTLAGLLARRSVSAMRCRRRR
jgi:D-xylose transport system permease protein